MDTTDASRRRNAGRVNDEVADLSPEIVRGAVVQGAREVWIRIDDISSREAR